MMRNLILIVAALSALTLGPACAQTYLLDITAQLRAQGYQNITLSQTWLGRTRIVALLGSDLREIVLDPNTGEILRDLSRTVMAEGSSGGIGTSTSSAVVASSGTGNGKHSGTVPSTLGAAAATALDGQVTPSATGGVSDASGASTTPAIGLTSAPGNRSGGNLQIGTPFQILGPAGGP